MIRAERADDVQPIGALTTAAFANAPHRSGTEAAIVDALRRAGALSVSLVADENGIIGHVAFSPVVVEGAPGAWYGLGPVSVHPGHQRRGIGKALIAAGLEQLRATGAAGCIVIGDPAYYDRFGFEADPSLTYREVPPEFIQRLVIRGPAPVGEVAYHGAFDIGV